MDYKGDPHRFLYRKRDCSMIGESTLFEGESSDNDHQDCNNAQNQLGIYSPADAAFDGIKSRPSQIRAYHIARSVVAFTAQCSVCFKWRFLPSKEKFEEIREHILEQPFVCAVAREWRPKISCNDDPDITQDGSKLWAIERPNTARPPLGWERLLKIRGPGGARFADVYYVTPSGMRLRSKVEVQRYLLEHPDEAEGVALSRFSFKIPRPLPVNHVKEHTGYVLALGHPSQVPQARRKRRRTLSKRRGKAQPVTSPEELEASGSQSLREVEVMLEWF